MIRLPPLEEIARRWSEIEPLVRKATDETDGCYEPVHVMQECLAGKRGFWLIEDDGKAIGICVAGAEEFPTGKRVWRVVYIAGDRADEWYPALMAEMDAQARKWRCDEMTANGRLGWERFSRRLGIELKPITVCYGRKIGEM